MANRSFELNNSSSDVNSIPCVGFGLWKVPKNVCADVVENAIRIGYRHLDCAADYGNEIEVGKVCKILIKYALNVLHFYVKKKNDAGLSWTFLGYKKCYSCRHGQTRGSLDYLQTLEYVS